MDRFIYEFVVNPIEKVVKVEHTSEKIAHAAVWKSLTDNERNATSDIELVDVHPVPLLTSQLSRLGVLNNATWRSVQPVTERLRQTCSSLATHEDTDDL